MDLLQKGVLILLKSAVTGERYELPDGFDLDAACHSMRRHHLAMLLYEGALNCGIPHNMPAMQQLFQQYCKSLLVSEAQMRELKRMYEVFDEHGIDYLPLKGSIMKYLYPRHELRMMGDADILIRVEQYDSIIPLMQKLGFTPIKESQHELVWDQKALHVELHKCLIPEREKTWTESLQNVWANAIRTSGHCYKMPDEDTFIFLFLHFAKHYTVSGIGCRHVLDLWVFLRTHPKLNQEYVKHKLAELDMLTFYQNTLDLLDVWFEGGASSEATDVMHAYIFSCGSFGTTESRIVTRELRKAKTDASGSRSKLGFLCARLFPPAKALQYEYPILQTKPWLLLFVWIVRLFKKLFGKKSVVKNTMHGMSLMNSQNVEKYTQIMEKSGISTK